MISVRNFCARFIVLRCLYRSDHVMTSTFQRKMPTLYGDDISPPVRFVVMTAEHLGIKLGFHRIDLFLGEHKTEFYAKVNPLQKVPSLDTGNGVIRDSHAMALFLCRQVAGTALYPEDTLLRAKVEEMLFFNSSNLFPIDSAILSEYFAGKSVDTDKVEQWYKLLDILETQLNTNAWLAGEQMTLGDLCCAATISSLTVLVPLLDRHAKVAEWMTRLEQVPCFKINTQGVNRLADIVKKYKTSS